MNSHSYNIHMGESIFFQKFSPRLWTWLTWEVRLRFYVRHGKSKSPAPFFRIEVSTLQLSPFITIHLKSFFIKDEWKVHLSLVVNHS